MRLGDYRKKEPYEKAEGARRTIGLAIRRDFPPKQPIDAANELAVITDIMERNRGLYGYDVPPAPRFRSGRLAYEAETARMGEHLGLLGEVGTAQATLGVAKRGRLGEVGAARERGRAFVEATGLTAGALRYGADVGLQGTRLQEAGLDRRAGGIAEKDKWAAVAELVKNLVPMHEAIAVVFGGKRAAGEFTGSNEQLDADIATAQAQEQTPEEIEEEDTAVRRYFPADKTPSLFEVKQAAKKRLGVVPARIRRAKELSEMLRTR